MDPTAANNQVMVVSQRLSDTELAVIGRINDTTGVASTTLISTEGANLWHYVECEVNADGTSAQWYLNGAATGVAVTTKIPTAAMQARSGIIKSNGATSKKFDLDAFYVIGEFTTPR